MTRMDGMTLIELLVSISIVAILGVISYTGLNNVLQTSTRVEASSEILKSLQMSFYLLENDLLNIRARPGRNIYDDTENILVFDDIGANISFSRTSTHEITPSGSFPVQRVTYGFNDGNWYRTVWPSVDLAPDSSTTETLLLKGVEELEWSALGENGHWQPLWKSLGQPNTDKRLPRAIRIELTQPQIGKIRRVFNLHET